MDLGARMVPFGGWDMPVQYPSGVLAEHHAVRERAGLFDIGHMGQFGFEGPDALAFLQWVTTHDVSRLEIGAAQYSLLCDEAGGILDDIIVYRLADTRYLMVVNAARTDDDSTWIARQLARPGRGVRPDRVRFERLSPQRTLLALQGPRATAVLRQLTPLDPGTLAYYHEAETTVAGVPALVASTGYTGERGYEISFDAGPRGRAVADTAGRGQGRRRGPLRAGRARHAASGSRHGALLARVDNPGEPAGGGAGASGAIREGRLRRRGRAA